MENFKITTNRLIIRELFPTDLEDFHDYRSNPEVTKHQGFDVMDLKQAEGFIKKNAFNVFGKPGEWIQYGIENIETQKLIGDCAIKLDQYDIRIAEIGITISHLHQKKGFGKEVLTGILNFLFYSKEIHRVVEIVDVENIASIHLLKSLGFRQEGHFVENVFINGKWDSEFQFAMLKREWEIKIRKL